MDDIETRRLFMEDHEWERTSASWKSLKPHRDFNQFRETDETTIEYHLRLQKTFDIPFDVVDQWLYPHYYNINTTNNYGWIDYNLVSFRLITLPFKQLATVNVVADYKPYVEGRSSAQAFSEFRCQKEDLEYWRTNLTWRIPPIIIDAESLHPIPNHAEVHSPYQIVEGHSRLGYLIATSRCGLVLGNSQHSVYVMRVLKK